MAFRQSVAQKGLVTQWDDLIMAQAGNDASLYALFKGVISQESEWNPTAENPSDPSIGLMQIMYGPRGPYPSMAREQIAEPSTNIVLGTNFLKGLLSRHSVPEAVSAYNQGEGGLNRRGIINQPYVDAVIQYQVWFLNNLPSSTSGASTVTVDDEGNVTPIDGETPSGGFSGGELAGGGIGLAILIGVGIYALART